MPRIDPLQLLKCLSVLLTPEGGILSRDEVPRLVNLMTKFSKKLVSKCVYVLILKNTETELVDMFMAEGGWTLIQTWLQDAVQTANWDLVREILGLLLVTPVDVERLKLNILPKLIKSLSRREELEGVAELSAQLVQQWLTIVKGSSSAAQAQQNQLQSAVPVVQPQETPQAQPVTEKIEEIVNDKAEQDDKAESKIEFVEESPTEVISTNTFYKSSGKTGKLVIRKFAVDENKEGKDKDEEVKEDKDDDKEKVKDRRSSSSKSSKSPSKSSSSRDKSRSKDEDKDKEKKSSKSSSYSSSKSKERDKKDKERSEERDKDKDREKDKDRDRDKDRHRRNGEVKSSSSSKSSKDKKDSKDKDRDKSKHKSDKTASKDKKDDDDKQAEKDKDTLAKLIPPPIDKLGRIPKKSGSSGGGSSSSSSSSSSSTTAEDKEKKESEAKKKSFSVGIKKDTNEERPKTVKIFNSKMRSTGLEEEIKPAPPRSSSGKKPTPSVQLPTIPQKRPSPPKDIRDPIVPPEKKLKIDKTDIPERPGSIKLIPPKPKPTLLESDLFNDALTAATKKEPKKRKRRASLSKDKETPTSPSSSPANEPPATPTSPTTTNVNNSTLGLKNIAPINFYQDTLSSEEVEVKDNKETKESNDDENKENASENVEDKPNPAVEDPGDDKTETPSSPPKTPTDDKDDEPLEPKKQRLDGGLKGVLLYSKKRGPKKSISWKNDIDLVEIRYFELDETERVNVTKTFGDMAKMDISSEREALQLSRKVGGEDLMEAQINWRVPFLLELDDPLAPPGCKSLEKDIQFAREKSVLQALYFDKRRIPDSPEEPIPENHQMSDPVLILLEDPESQEIDLRTTPWPEPKGLPPQPEPKPVPPVFQNIPVPFQPPFNNMTPPNFQGLQQRFVAPGAPMGPVGPGNFIPPNMMVPNNVMVPPNMGPSPHEMMNLNPNMFPHGPVLDNFIPGPENFGPMHDGFGPPGPDCFGPSMAEGYGPGPGPGPDGFGPGPDYPMFPNQNQPNNMNMYHPNKFRDHRQNNRGFRRGGGGNSGGWKQISGNSNNWKKGRGGRLCKNVQNHGFCRNRDNCPFVHP